jgi:hypothetical protein
MRNDLLDEAVENDPRGRIRAMRRTQSALEGPLG